MYSFLKRLDAGILSQTEFGLTAYWKRTRPSRVIANALHFDDGVNFEVDKCVASRELSDCEQLLKSRYAANLCTRRPGTPLYIVTGRWADGGWADSR